MSEKQAVIMVGNLNDGWTIVGPFDSWDEAADYDMNHKDHNPRMQQTWIMLLTSIAEDGR